MRPPELRAVRALAGAARRVVRTVRDPRLVEACELVEQDALDLLAREGPMPPLEVAEPPAPRPWTGRERPLQSVAEELEEACCSECGAGEPDLLQLVGFDDTGARVLCSSCLMVAAD